MSRAKGDAEIHDHAVHVTPASSRFHDQTMLRFAITATELDDWPIDVADLRESLRESEADIAAGRTFGEDEIRTRYGLPRK